jgi:hypothetical protein
MDLRKAVGWIGILLPFTLMIGVLFVFDEGVIQESISHYYYTGMGDVFVGALCAVALFMFFYSGYDKRDDWAGHLAGVFALGAAWFPVTETGTATGAGIIHLISAGLFFFILAVFSLFLFTRGEENPTRQKLNRNKIYVICGLVILACLIAITIYHTISLAENSKSSFVFWAETVALVAFGFSWLTKGEAIFPDPNYSDS